MRPEAIVAERIAGLNDQTMPFVSGDLYEHRFSATAKVAHGVDTRTVDNFAQRSVAASQPQEARLPSRELDLPFERVSPTKARTKTADTFWAVMPSAPVAPR